jgi:hypothetical protein
MGRSLAIVPNGVRNFDRFANLELVDGEIPGMDVGSQLSFRGYFSALYQSTSSPPEKKRCDEQQSSERGDRVCPKFVPPIFLWLGFAALGIAGINWLHGVGFRAVHDGRQLFGRTCLCGSLFLILGLFYLLFFDWGLCSLWGLL